MLEYVQMQDKVEGVVGERLLLKIFVSKSAHDFAHRLAGKKA